MLSDGIRKTIGADFILEKVIISIYTTKLNLSLQNRKRKIWVLTQRALI